MSKRTTEQSGVDLIAAERRRQIEEEEWSPAHDDKHWRGELAMAAAAYAAPAWYGEGSARREALRLWPWERYWWKPTPHDRVRELVKAGALIAAEIDRLLRKHNRSPQPPHLRPPLRDCPNCGGQGGEDGSACQVCQ